MVLRITRLIVLVTSLLAFNATAIEVTALYDAKVAIKNKSRQARITAYRDALRQVLVKVSGNHQVLEFPHIKANIKNATNYLVKFQFTREDNNQQMLQAEFEPKEINRLLLNAGANLWGKRRPLSVTWIAVQDGKYRNFLNDENHPILSKQIRSAAQRRGIPITVPLFDLEDSQYVNVADIWGKFYSPLQQASIKYGAESIVSAKLYLQENAQWALDWTIYDEESRESGQLVGDKLSVVNQLPEVIADHYAKQYAITASSYSQNNTVNVTIGNLSTIRDLVMAERVIKGLSSTGSLKLTKFHNKTAEFDVALVGLAIDLVQSMDLENKFTKVFNPLASKEEQKKIEYLWQN